MAEVKRHNTGCCAVYSCDNYIEVIQYRIPFHLIGNYDSSTHYRVLCSLDDIWRWSEEKFPDPRAIDDAHPEPLKYFRSDALIAR